MSRAFCIPGIAFLSVALLLSFLVSISLPSLPALDIARTNYRSGGVSADGGEKLVQLRYGIWGYCAYTNEGHRTCSPSHHGYQVPVLLPEENKSALVKSAWTRGLAVHPVATATIFIALVLSFSTHITVTLLASLVSFLAALLSLIAFAIDIALYVLVRNAMNDLGIGASTRTGAALWMTFVSIILLVVAGCTVCFGQRRERNSGATTVYPLQTKNGIWSKLRNRN